jgi:two-component system CheB/CheR fusion protein
VITEPKLPTQNPPEAIKILVVDDEPDIRLMLELFLRQAGYRIVTAATAEQALKLAQEDSFNLVVSDIGMPVMDGYALAAALRQMHAYAQIPLIAITGFVEFLNLERALDAGFDERFTKPVNLKALLKSIKRWQNKARRVTV